MVILAGCGQAAPDAHRPSARSTSVRPGAVEGLNTKIAVDRLGKTAAGRAIKLERCISGIEDVDRASVVITGNTAMIGISLAGETEDFSDRRLMRLKSRVESEARRLDPELIHVAVTTSSEFIERINNFADPLGVDDTPPRINPDLKRVIDELTPPV